MNGAILTFARATCAAILLIASGAGAQPPANSPTAEEISSLSNYLKTVAHDRNTYYVAAFRDLDGDGAPEAIVYLLSSEWCGSGGCNTLVLRRDGNSWKIVGNISITNPPIYVLPSESNGWHDIAVRVEGGGIRGYDAQLRFDGTSYPGNPTVPPARRMQGQPGGSEMILSTHGAVLLYTDRKPRANHP